MHYLSFRSFDVSFVPFISHLLSRLIPCINPPKMSHLKKKRALKRDRATRITATNFYLRIRPPIATNSMPRIDTLQQSQLFFVTYRHTFHTDIIVKTFTFTVVAQRIINYSLGLTRILKRPRGHF